MNPGLLLLMKSGASVKKEIGIALTTVVVIVCLPVAAVFGLTNPVVIASNPSGYYTGTGDASITGYDWGNCTYWAALMRLQSGKPIPQNWGNANTWAVMATLAGYQVDHTPAPTAIMQTTAGALGHVAFVTAVDPSTGAWTISEMNAIGFNMVDSKTYAASAATKYSFIHDPLSKGGL